MAASSNSNVNVSTSNTEVRLIGRRHSVLMYLWCVTLHCACVTRRKQQRPGIAKNGKNNGTINTTNKPTTPNWVFHCMASPFHSFVTTTPNLNSQRTTQQTCAPNIRRTTHSSQRSFGFVRAALLPAVGICVVLSFGVMPGWCCFLRVTHSSQHSTPINTQVTANQRSIPQATHAHPRPRQSAHNIVHVR